MRTFTITYWTGATETFVAANTIGAAHLAGYSFTAEEGTHFWDIGSDNAEVTNSDGERVATITEDKEYRIPRFSVSPFATNRFGESPYFGWRIIDQVGTRNHRIIAVFENENVADTFCESLNVAAFYAPEER